MKLINDVKETTIDQIYQNNKELNKTSSEENKDSEIFIGDFAISGKPTASLYSPKTNTPCVYFKYRKDEVYYERREDSDGKAYEKKCTKTVYSKTKTAPFSLATGNKNITVNPEEYSTEYVGLKTLCNIDQEHGIKYEYEEEVMGVNQNFTVVGSLYEKNGEFRIEKSKNHGSIVIANVSFEELTKKMTKTVKNLLIGSVICDTIGGGLIAYGLYLHLIAAK